MCEPQLRTPGMDRSSTQAATVTRVSSGCDVPGAVTQCIKKSRSLKSGRSDWPSCGHTATPTTLTKATVANAGRAERMMRVRAPA